MRNTNYSSGPSANPAVNPYAAPARSRPAAQAAPDERGAFISRVYNHLVGSILAFIGFEFLLFKTGVAAAVSPIMFASNWGWLAILGAFAIVGSLFSGMAAKAVSPRSQYMALGGYVFAEALILMPLLWMASMMDPTGNMIMTAGAITMAAFIGLSAIAFFTRKDFSFMKTALMWIGMVAIIAIVASLVLGFNLGVWFSAAMVVFAGALILYETSKVIHHYPTDRHVAACLALFAAIAVMFWYVLRILMSRR